MMEGDPAGKEREGERKGLIGDVTISGRRGGGEYWCLVHQLSTVNG